MTDNTNGKEYTIERLGKNNLCDLDKLHTAVYGKHHRPAISKKNMILLILVSKI